MVGIHPTIIDKYAMKLIAVLSIMLLVTACSSTSNPAVAERSERAADAARIYGHCVLGLHRGSIGDYEEYTQMEQVTSAMTTMETWCMSWMKVWFEELVDKKPLNAQELAEFNYHESAFMNELKEEYVNGSAIPQSVTAVDAGK